MEEREPKLIVAVGRKGVGKTYTTNQLLQKYVMGNPALGVWPRRVLIFDVNDEFEQVRALRIADVMKFSAHPKIEIRRIRPFLDDGRPMGINDLQEALTKILYGFRNGLLLVEDINKYLSDHLPQDLIGKIVSARHSDLDIITHFQSIGRITPKIWQNVNAIRYHKNTDSVERHKNKFENHYEILSLTEAFVNSEYENGNKRISVYVDLDDEKIMIPHNQRLKFEKIVEDYLKANFKTLLKPKMETNVFNTGKKLDPIEALRIEKEKLLKQYLVK